MEESKEMMEKFAASGWELLSLPALRWLKGNADGDELISAIMRADKECGNCGCEFGPLYKRAIELI
ncbi:MAG: hypothetical protein HFK07_05975 [Clostridia bacterium]|jgi:hypothetical protein|nr:hypothetical protein [Clostridia bacterium]